MVSLRPTADQAQPKCLVLPQCNWGTVLPIHPVLHVGPGCLGLMGLCGQSCAEHPAE